MAPENLADGYKVMLNIYDLSRGMARRLSAAFLGKAIEAIWHTGVVVYGNEYYFGGGIQHAPEGTTPYGAPMRVMDLGVTHVPKELFEEFLQEIGPRYTAETYKLLTHNCNNFSNEVAQFLVGTNIPDYILQLPNEILSSPMGPMILPMLQQLEMTLGSGGVPQAPQFRPPMHTAVVANQTSSGDSVMSDSHVVESPESKVPDLEYTVPDDLEKPTVADPLGDARNQIQEEITREVAALMASGELGASEAVALATRKVMERHGLSNTLMQQE